MCFYSVWLFLQNLAYISHFCFLNLWNNKPWNVFLIINLCFSAIRFIHWEEWSQPSALHFPAFGVRSNRTWFVRWRPLFRFTANLLLVQKRLQGMGMFRHLSSHMRLCRLCHCIWEELLSKKFDLINSWKRWLNICKSYTHCMEALDDAKSVQWCKVEASSPCHPNCVRCEHSLRFDLYWQFGWSLTAQVACSPLTSLLLCLSSLGLFLNRYEPSIDTQPLTIFALSRLWTTWGCCSLFFCVVTCSQIRTTQNFQILWYILHTLLVLEYCLP